ncbi:unnamed protein product [Ectocarpus sp. 8 AP-2014]
MRSRKQPNPTLRELEAPGTRKATSTIHQCSMCSKYPACEKKPINRTVFVRDTPQTAEGKEARTPDTCMRRKHSLGTVIIRGSGYTRVQMVNAPPTKTKARPAAGRVKHPHSRKIQVASCSYTHPDGCR